MSEHDDTGEKGDIPRTKTNGPEEGEKTAPPIPPVLIKSKVSIIKDLTGEEFICIPRQAYKYILCIPQTIALKERFIEARNVKVEEYPIPLDWGLLTEFFINGIKTPFNSLKIILSDDMKIDPYKNILPPMPKVIING